MRSRGWLSCWLIGWIGVGLLAADAAQAVPFGVRLPELPSPASALALLSVPLVAPSWEAPTGLVLSPRLGSGGLLVQIGLRIGLFSDSGLLSDFDRASHPPMLRDLFAAIRANPPLRGRSPFGSALTPPIPPVPEPGSALLLMLGLTGLTLAGRRRA
jgi:PEP-CTERM motif